jgi:MraZ protein
MFNGFIGRYLHNLDEKGRITFPVSYRERLGDSPFILSGFDQNLLVMTNARFQQLYYRINAMNMANADARQLKRMVFSTASEIEFDKTGRLLIPPTLREIARLDGSVLVMGAGKDIELWDPHTYESAEKVGELPKTAADLVANFELTF